MSNRGSHYISCNDARLAVVGNSVGGYMTAVVSQMAKDRRRPAIRVQGLMWPVTDHAFDNATLFADDGALELPYLKSLGIDSCARGPKAIEGFIAPLLAKLPHFAFKNVRFLIETPQCSPGSREGTTRAAATDALAVAVSAAATVVELKD